ncbi:MAG: hypothetical protein ACFFDT_00465 [Candidatus Hodarchaeota archaeon]
MPEVKEEKQSNEELIENIRNRLDEIKPHLIEKIEVDPSYFRKLEEALDALERF